MPSKYCSKHRSAIVRIIRFRHFISRHCPVLQRRHTQTQTRTSHAPYLASGSACLPTPVCARSSTCTPRGSTAVPKRRLPACCGPRRYNRVRGSAAGGCMQGRPMHASWHGPAVPTHAPAIHTPRAHSGHSGTSYYCVMASHTVSSIARRTNQPSHNAMQCLHGTSHPPSPSPATGHTHRSTAAVHTLHSPVAAQWPRQAKEGSVRHGHTRLIQAYCMRPADAAAPYGGVIRPRRLRMAATETC